MNQYQIKHLLNTEPRAVEKGILRLHANQTADEQSAGVTVHSNGVGFNGRNAAFGSSLAEWIQSGKRLTPKQLVGARKICTLHVKQLEAESEARLAASTLLIREGSLALLDPFQQ